MRLCALILAGLAASTLNWSGATRAAPAASAEERLPHISVTTMGKGSPVILIPGLSSPRAVWDGVAPAIAAGHKVVLVQVNGFAGDAPGANLSPGVIDGAVSDLHGYIQAHKLAGAKVVGHSLGGLVALDLAKAHSSDASALLIVDALPYVGDIFLPGVTVTQVEPKARAMRDQMVASYGKPAADALRTASSMAVTPAAQAKIATWMANSDSRVAGEAMYEDMTLDLRPALAAIKTPITLVYPTSGATPKATTDAFYRSEYAKAPAITYVPIADSGHFVMLDQPNRFAEAVLAFVK